MCLEGLVPRSRSASNTLTHIQCFRKTRKICPQIPSPRTLCTVYLYECVRVRACVLLFNLHTVVVCGSYAPCRNVPKPFASQCIKRCCIPIVRDTCITQRKMCTQEFPFSTHDAPVSLRLPLHRWGKGLLLLFH